MYKICLVVVLNVAPLLTLQAAPTIGSKLPQIELASELGGRVDGLPWNSESLKDKVITLFYVDPDEKDLNPEMEQTLKAQEFPEDRYASVAVINMKATWLPNIAIAASLKSKQTKYPKTTYVKDLQKTLVQKWQLADDAYHVLVFDRMGTVLYSFAGKFDAVETQKLIETIRKNL